MTGSVSKHSKRQAAGLEHIDRGVHDIVEIMEERAAEKAAKLLSAEPVLAPNKPQLLDSPDKKLVGVLHNGQCAWIPASGTVEGFDLATDEYLLSCSV